jgi:hypothetical protein
MAFGEVGPRLRVGPVRLSLFGDKCGFRDAKEVLGPLPKAINAEGRRISESFLKLRGLKR